MLKLIKSLLQADSQDDPAGPNGGCYGPYAHRVPPGWKDMRIAPRDGTIIEIRCNYGICPHYGLYKFNCYHHWSRITDELAGLSDDVSDYNSWREYKGDPLSYIDPTNGAQETNEYWNR